MGAASAAAASAVLVLRLLLCLVLLVVGLSFASAAAAGVAGCDFGGGGRASAGGRRFGATALLHLLLEVFVGDGDVVLVCLHLEHFYRVVFEAELVDDVCEPDAFFAAGIGVVKQTARRAHCASSEFRARFLARGAECADFGGVGGALSEQAVVGAQSFATAWDANATPRDGDALFLRGFCEFRGFPFGLGGFLFGFLGGSPFSLGGFFGGSLFGLGGFLFGILVGFLGGCLFSLAGFFGGFLFGFLGGFE